jgi:hypothetical protein
MSELIPFNPAEQKIPNIVIPKVQRYVNDFVMHYDKCTDAILALAETCFEAKQNLTQAEFKIFLREINLERKNATVSKYLKIGSVSTRFRKIAAHLPSTWTVLYKLACLDNATFNSIAPIISKDTTAKDIYRALGTQNMRMPLTVPDMTINLNNKGACRKREIYLELKELSIKLNFNIKLSKTFENEIFNTNLKEAA